MPYKVPTFNLLCKITAPDEIGVDAVPAGEPRLVDVPCQLTYGRRVQVASTGGTASVGVLALSMNLLVAARTDVRGPQDSVSYDLVEVPQGTGRWYRVVAVDDIGRGFSNEHRSASIYALAGQWLAPYP